ncbi:phosphatidate phosphatase LPIN1-like isoform X2 [Hypomesus transpacificus]|nr:phosphatidate phosphatase LPIN1-like isoform X2 [Hypomesus transpacificus]
MNYVGQLAGQVFVQVKELYRGLNPATLSGCIDVIVVRRPDGTLHCSPFHVRFGKMGVFHSREKLVDIEINGEPVSLHMKLGENGEAFFVKETENMLEVIPPYLATSPILSDGAGLMEAQLGRGVSRNTDPAPGTSLPVLGSQQEGGMIKKRRKRRRKVRGESGRREESGEYSDEDEDMFTIDMSSDEERDDDNIRSSSLQGSKAAMQSSRRSSFLRSEPEWTRSQSTMVEQMCSLSLPPSGGLSISCPQQTSLFPSSISIANDSHTSMPRSESELTNQGRDNPEMLWAWGELPHAAQPSLLPPSHSPDPAGSTMAPVSIRVSDSTHFRTISGDQAPPDTGPHSLTVPQLRDTSPGPGARARAGPGAGPGDGPGREMECVSAACREVEGATAARMLPVLEGGGNKGSPARSTDSPSKKNDKRSRHLGSDGIYLDDITDLEPEVAALYFPKSDGASSSVRVGSEMGVRSASQSPQSLAGSGVDSGVDSLSDQIGDLPNIAISLCGGLTDNREITAVQFQERAISYQQFSENPSIIDDPNLVVKIGTKYYNWTSAAPIMLAMQVYQKPLPKATVENIMKEKMPRKGGRWWFSWRGRNSDSKSDSISEAGGEGDEATLTMSSMTRMKDESSSSDEEHRSANQGSGSFQAEPLLTPGSVCYRKTLRLTSEQLASLQLKDGANDVVFSVTTQYQGTCRCQGRIYLWSWDDKIVISDIDGTITRSDTLGHILPTLGKDWTHQGIARLYHRVSQNGYKFMYCSARAIGMADMTRGYLNWVNERGTMLPMGPVMLSPSSLFSALHREVIEKKPEKFKVECLTDIKQLFLPNTEPFYAAFGNRATDVYSYKEVGVPLNRIFTVNPKGELIQEHAKTNISSYGRLCEVVDHVFPLLVQGQTCDVTGSDTLSQLTCWREQLPPGPAQNPDPAPPPAPAPPPDSSRGDLGAGPSLGTSEETHTPADAEK